MSSEKIGRRLAIGGMLASGAAMFDSLVVEPHWLDVNVQEVQVEGLPLALDGFKVAQVTDAHLTRLGVVEETIVEAVHDEDVDLVALTGDLIDSERHLGVLSGLLSALKANHRGLVATLGNWEHWGNVPREQLRRVYEEADVKLLVNESARVANGVKVYGTDDATGGIAEFNMDQGSKDGLLLTHSPGVLEKYPEEAGRMALTLAGHTHGGQVRLGSSLVPFVPPGSGRFVAGWYRTAAGREYVSRGTGTSVLPVRFSCRPELPMFVLRRA